MVSRLSKVTWSKIQSSFFSRFLSLQYVSPYFFLLFIIVNPSLGCKKKIFLYIWTNLLHLFLSSMRPRESICIFNQWVWTWKAFVWSVSSWQAWAIFKSYFQTLICYCFVTFLCPLYNICFFFLNCCWILVRYVLECFHSIVSIYKKYSPPKVHFDMFFIYCKFFNWINLPLELF